MVSMAGKYLSQALVAYNLMGYWEHPLEYWFATDWGLASNLDQ
jgi:hypothetical protein